MSLCVLCVSVSVGQVGLWTGSCELVQCGLCGYSAQWQGTGPERWLLVCGKNHHKSRYKHFNTFSRYAFLTAFQYCGFYGAQGHKDAISIFLCTQLELSKAHLTLWDFFIILVCDCSWAAQYIVSTSTSNVQCWVYIIFIICMCFRHLIV